MVALAAPPAPAVLRESGVATWEEFVVGHRGRVYALAYRLSGNRADAEDLTQETFLRAFRAAADFRPGATGAWLARITTNLFLDLTRQRARTPVTPWSAELERWPASDDPSLAGQGAFDPDVEAALLALDPVLRAAVVLRDVEGLTYREIATALDVSIGTVRSRLHRARGQLRRSLAHRRPRRVRRGL